jgi:hypothetical protein
MLRHILRRAAEQGVCYTSVREHVFVHGHPRLSDHEWPGGPVGLDRGDGRCVDLANGDECIKLRQRVLVALHAEPLVPLRCAHRPLLQRSIALAKERFCRHALVNGIRIARRAAEQPDEEALTHRSEYPERGARCAGRQPSEGLNRLQFSSRREEPKLVFQPGSGLRDRDLRDAPPQRRRTAPPPRRAAPWFGIAVRRRW